MRNTLHGLHLKSMFVYVNVELVTTQLQRISWASISGRGPRGCRVSERVKRAGLVRFNLKHAIEFRHAQ